MECGNAMQYYVPCYEQAGSGREAVMANLPRELEGKIYGSVNIFSHMGN